MTSSDFSLCILRPYSYDCVVAFNIHLKVLSSMNENDILLSLLLLRLCSIIFFLMPFASCSFSEWNTTTFILKLCNDFLIWLIEIWRLFWIITAVECAIVMPKVPFQFPMSAGLCLWIIILLYHHTFVCYN